MTSLINDYAISLLSPLTKQAYTLDLRQVEEFLGLSLITATSEQLAAYRDYLIGIEACPATINRKFSSIRNFYKWALRKGKLTANPSDHLELPRWEVKNSTLALKDHEAVKMIDEPDVTSFRGNTHRMTLVFLLYLGLRRSELVKLKFSDVLVESEHTYVRIKGKGGKYRSLPLNAHLLKEIEDYKARSLQMTGRELSHTDYIIQTSAQKKNLTPSAPSTIYRIVRRSADALKINQRIGAHSCRATVISHLIDTKKIPIRDVADFAGHSNTVTTQIYDKKRDGMTNSAAYSVGY